jgi:hypothetical protein
MVDDSKVEGEMDPELREALEKMVFEDKVYVKNHSVLISNRDWQRNIKQTGFFWYFKLSFYKKWKVKLYDSKEEFVLRKLTEDFE